MPLHDAGGLRYFTFEHFDRHNLIHGIFCRLGGVSPEPWASLNLGGTVGDARANVIENRRRIFDHFGRPVETVFDSWQVHGTHVLCTDEPRPLDSSHQQADAILTDQEDVTLMMRFADCVPIFLYDPVHHVIGLVHAGWRGTVDRVAAVAIERMGNRYQSNPEDILAGIGPSICVDHYPVGHEVVTAVRATFGEESDGILLQRNRSIHFDLWKANQIILETSGVYQIELSRQCTACHVNEWFSHRAEKGRTGRFGALLALSSSTGMENKWELGQK